MDIKESISWLASVHSGKCYPKREEDVDKTIPYFELDKSITGKYIFKGYNFETHDNAPRMGFVAYYLTNFVLPYAEGDVTGFYNIQLHDNYTYLNDNKDYTDVLCFGGSKTKKNVVMLPDCYFMGNWDGKYTNFEDNMKFDTKKSKIIFAGTTTGSRVPVLNKRIQTCIWGMDKDACDFYITNIAQIEPKRIFSEVSDFKYIYRPPIPLSEQLKYKYHLVLDGNTCRWNPDVFFMNSLAFQMQSNDMLWYYPLLQEGTHYVHVDYTNMLDKYLFYEENVNEAKTIICNAHTLAKKLFTKDVCQQYCIALFENIAINK